MRVSVSTPAGTETF